MATKALLVQWHGRSEPVELPITEPEEQLDVPELSDFTKDQQFAILAEVMRTVLEICWSTEKGNPVETKRGCMRMGVFAFMLRPEMMPDVNLTSIGEAFGLTRFPVARIAREISRRVGLVFPANHSGRRFARRRVGQRARRP